MYAFQVTNKKMKGAMPPYISKKKYNTLEQAEEEAPAFAQFVKQTLIDTGVAKQEDLEVSIVEWVEDLARKP